MPKLRVHILGAGCSFDEQCGYPLAKQFIPELRAYADGIADAADCQKIKKAVEFTAALLNACQTGACHAATIDQLVNLILNGRCDEQIRALGSPQPNNAALRYDAVRKAKIATSAFFLEREGRVLNRQLGKYREFIQRKVLDETGVSERSQNRLRKSTARVLSFNYDRLFELSFLGAFADAHIKEFFPYHSEVLNSGLGPVGKHNTNPARQVLFPEATWFNRDALRGRHV